jgi:hypothetical protein
MADRLSPQKLREMHTFTAAQPKTHVPRIVPIAIGFVAAVVIGALAFVAIQGFLAEPAAPIVQPLPASESIPSLNDVESRLG